MAKRRARKLWSDEEKVKICRQARLPDVSVSQVARRYDVNANLLFTWLRDERYRSVDCVAGANDVPTGTEAEFLPVEIVEHGDVRTQQPPTEAGERQADPSVLEVELVCGHRLRIVGAYDPDALAHLIRSLSA